MPEPTPKHNSKSATPADVVFWFTANGLCDPPMTIWRDHDQPSLDKFLDDMDALGFAVWCTEDRVYVFCGEIE